MNKANATKEDAQAVSAGQTEGNQSGRIDTLRRVPKCHGRLWLGSFKIGSQKTIDNLLKDGYIKSTGDQHPFYQRTRKGEAILHDHDKTAENPAENAGEGQDFARTEKE